MRITGNVYRQSKTWIIIALITIIVLLGLREMWPHVWSFVAIWYTISMTYQSAAVEISSPIYTVIAPSKLRPSIAYHVSVSAFNLASPLELKIGIEGPTDNDQYNSIGKEITLNSGETQIVNFEIGPWSSGNYSLIVSGEGGIRFKNQTVLIYEQKSYSVFIQTDKAIYKPGQLVQFRALVVNPSLVPVVTGAINMFVTDSSGNRIKQWNRVFTTKGVVSSELQLSDQPVLGEWTINIDVLGQIFKKTFTVTEYVLPTFDVSIDLPPYATYQKSDIIATVTAKYTYGKSVKGNVKLMVKPSLRFGYLSNENRPAVIEKQINGSVDIPINLMNDLGLKEDTLTLEIDITAEVEEELTKRKYNSSSTIKVYDRDIKVELIKSSESFKPGLKYTANLKVSYQDDTPASVTNGDQIILKYGYSYDEKEWESRLISIPNNGLISVDFFPPINQNLSFLSMNAEFRGLQYYLDNVEAAMSPSNNFIQVLLRTPSPTVDKEIKLEINATEPLSNIVYEVLGRGDIILAGSIDIPNVKTYLFSLPVFSKMAPKARVVVYYVRASNNEIVADAVNFDVTGVFKTPVNIYTDVSETKPGGDVSVNVETKPNALVGILGIDQSVLLLKSGNDITQDDVINELETYDGGKKKRFNHFYRKKRSLWWPGSATAHEVFDDSGVVMLTNGLVYRYFQLIMYRSYHTDGEGLEHLEGQLGMKSTSGSDQSHRVRKHFPETWLWELNQAGNDGKMSISSKAPDTITSWVISAFAIHSVTGLGISPTTSKVTVFRPFFVKLNLPYSVIRSESVYIEAIIFNYNKKPMKAVVTLENLNGEFEFTTAGNEVDPSQQSQKSKTVEVPPEDGVLVPFLITPKKIGYIDLKVTATSKSAGDSVVRKLLVKAEGAPLFFNKAVLVDLRDTNSKPLKSTVNIPIPGDAVAGSESVTISAIGDLLGPTVNNIDHLLRMPYGCGEQNMLNFVPNIVITQYLHRANRLSPAIKKKSLHYMESGYQRELTYKRDDGSFSAFGNSDKNGSTWLTAFVVRSFHQAEGFLDIDERVMETALQWLVKRQRNDGSFMELGEVHHKAMQGGSGSGASLTAYVLISLLENQVEKKYGKEMDLATLYLLKELGKSTDPYVVSVITYALHLADHAEKDNALQKLLSLATRGVDSIHWSQKGNKEDQAYQARSQDVEMTAYALLTYSLRADVAGSLPILRWMISQQNENGGYSSTQDTVVGIQALASLASRLVSPTIAINVTYSYNNGKRRTLNITSENAMVLQKVMLPEDTRIVELEAVGFGVGIIQVSWSYNLESSGETPTFSLKPVISEKSTDNYMELNICTSYNDAGASNMAVMEVGLPSGYQADAETFPSIKSQRSIKRVEANEGDTNVVIYFDRIDDEICVSVPAHLNHKVANRKPVPVKVYDYYDLAKSARIFYEPKSASLCNICDGEDCGNGCNAVVSGPSGGCTALLQNTLLLTMTILLVLQYSKLH